MTVVRRFLFFAADQLYWLGNSPTQRLMFRCHLLGHRWDTGGGQCQYIPEWSTCLRCGMRCLSSPWGTCGFGGEHPISEHYGSLGDERDLGHTLSPS